MWGARSAGSFNCFGLLNSLAWLTSSFYPARLHCFKIPSKLPSSRLPFVTRVGVGGSSGILIMAHVSHASLTPELSCCLNKS